MSKEYPKDWITPEELVRAISPSWVRYLEDSYGRTPSHPEDLLAQSSEFFKVAAHVYGALTSYTNKPETMKPWTESPSQETEN